MTQRSSRRRAATVLALLAIPTSFVFWQYLTLWSYQLFIREHFSAEINQLETAMLHWPENPDQDEAAREKLKKTFRSGDFYGALWSYDSHHGLKSTGFPHGGFSTYSWVSTMGPESLSYGTSSDGVPLLVYKRWLPESPVMRHVQIVLYRDRVNQRMKADPRG